MVSKAECNQCRSNLENQIGALRRETYILFGGMSATIILNVINLIYNIVG